MRAGFAIGAAVFSLVGCLADSRRPAEDIAETGIDGGGDTALDGGGDTGGDARDGDAVNPCGSDGECDDGDPCTFDQCVGGACQNLAVPGGGAPASGCISNADCEDGDPCTINTCIDLGCGAGGFCTAEPVPGCGSCTTGCDDQDPCTRDGCLDGQCFHSFEDGCMAGCVSAGSLSIAAIRTQGGGFPGSVKTTGELYFHEIHQSCDDGPNCGCFGWPGLRDGGYELALRNPDPPQTEPGPWQCTSHGCAQGVGSVCEPARFGVRYRVWGRGVPEWELISAAPGDPAVPAPMTAGIVVEDFCLETAGQALLGTYDGMIEVGGYTMTFKASIVQGTAGLRLAWGGGICQQCPTNVVLGPFDAPITVGDGWIEFEALLPSLIGETSETVRLYSNRNTLIGRYGQRSGVVPFIALPQGGLMVLTRLP